MARSRLYEEEVLVVGLGRFGSAAACELRRLGHTVVALERDAARAEHYSALLDKVIQTDATSPGAFSSPRLRGFAFAVIAVGSVESSLLCAGNLIDLGVSSLWAKAVSPEHARILERLGVHHVISPEAESGKRVAHLVNGRMLDYIEFDDGFAIARTRAPEVSWDRTLEETGLRRNYAITVVGVKSRGQDFTYARPETSISRSDELIVCGPTQNVEKFCSLTNS